MSKKARVIAFYLPQFHPIPENDEWWGKGFTEWTNVGKAKPLFRGHQQPRVPADLGYYDLRMTEIRESQAQLAKDAGVEGFMYWHYWFGSGKTILERPFNEMLDSRKPNFPFCLGWANHSWTTKTWSPKDQYAKPRTLIEQKYLGKDDYTAHFNYLLKAFLDPRYIRKDNKPVFLLYSPMTFPDVKNFIRVWNELAIINGLEGIHFIGQTIRNADYNTIIELGFDAVCRSGYIDAIDKINGRYVNSFLRRLRNKIKYAPLYKFDYNDVIKYLPCPELDKLNYIYPTVIPNFDHSPRSGRKGLIFINSRPELFKKLLECMTKAVEHKAEEDRIIFLRSWNEWAEGNYVEPDMLHGKGYLTALSETIFTEDT